MKNIFNSQKLAFWNHWKKEDRLLYLISLSVFALSIVFFIFSYHFGLDLLIKWNVVNETVGVNTKLDEFERNLNSYSLEVQTFFVTQHFEAGKLHINSLAAQIYLFFVAFSATLIITAISMVRKVFWYAVGMTFFFAWLAFMKLDTLAVLGFENNALLIICLLLFGGISFYFHAYKTEVSTIVRFFVFLGIILGLGTFILFTSKLAHPYIHLTNYGTIINSLVAIIFIVMVGYDILNGFFSISIESQTSPTKGLINFVIISILYLSNLLLVFLDQIGVVTWQLNFFNPFYLFVISAILGIWAHRRRSVLIKNIIEFHSAGALLFIGLAINATITFAYAFATTNNPMISVLNDTIIYSFLSVGFLFVIYLVMNFIDPLKKGINIYEYIFEPTVVGHYFVRVGGVALMIFMLGKHSYLPYKHWFGAYHNYIGDVYTINNDIPLAEFHYKKSNQFAPLNHKSIYTLASLYLEKQDYGKAEEYFSKLVLGDNLSEFACVNLAYTYEQTGKPFQSIFTLQEGIKKFPKSGIINHNLAYFFQKHNKNLLDSIYHYYHNASQYLDDPSIANGNILTLLGENEIKVNTDSLFNTLNKNNKVLQNNYLALTTVLAQKNSLEIDVKKWQKDSIADTETSCLLYNYAFTRLAKNDTLLKNTLVKFIKHKESAYPENLKFALACLYYYDNQVLEAKKTMDNILSSCSNQLFPYYSNFTGTLLYKKYLTKLSKSYFEESTQAQRFLVINSAPSNYAFNVAENRNAKEMEFPLLLLENLKGLPQQTYQELKNVYQNTSFDIENSTDRQKFQYLAYHPNSIDDSVKCLKVLRSFKDEQLKAQTCAMILDKLISQNNRNFAETIWNEVPKIELYPRILEELNFQYLQLLPLQYKFKELSDRLDNIKLSDERKLYYYYYKGIAFEALGDTANAKIAFKAATEVQSLFDKAYIRYSNYLSEEDGYNFLVNASYLIPESVEIYKKLALKSLDNYLESYAEVSLNEVQKLSTEKEFLQFKAIYEQRKIDAAKKFEQGI